MEKLKDLYKSLSLRKRPEDVAEMVFAVLQDELTPAEKKILQKAAKGSLKNKWLGYTSMLEDFGEVIGAQKQIKKAIELFELSNMSKINGSFAPDIEAFIDEVSPIIGKSKGKNNFLSDRMNKIERKSNGFDISKRQYNKKWRLLNRLEKKLLRFQRETRKKEFQKIAKHGIVHRLDFELFSKDVNTACFIAYYNARCNKRSVFTNKSQERAFDEICEMLFRRCKGFAVARNGIFGKRLTPLNGETNWLAISYIYTSQEVLKNLTEKEKGKLLGRWTTILQDIAQLLGEIWGESSFNRKSMIVRKGNDSTSWNNTAGAWNKARDNWINLIFALGMEEILDEFCFGKVMRLMAADVAFWHRATGGDIDPNTKVWNDLPLPWKVLNGEETCNRAMVVSSCKSAGIDVAKSGWIAPRKHGVVKFKPTPELVHGVEVFNPFFAKILKQNKVFSGKKSAVKLW